MQQQPEPADVYLTRMLRTSCIQDHPLIEPGQTKFSVVSCSQCNEWNIDGVEIRPGLWRLEWFFFPKYEEEKRSTVELHELVDGAWTRRDEACDSHPP